MSEQSENGGEGGGGGSKAAAETVGYVEENPKIITNQLKNYVANRANQELKKNIITYLKSREIGDIDTLVRSLTGKGFEELSKNEYKGEYKIRVPYTSENLKKLSETIVSNIRADPAREYGGDFSINEIIKLISKELPNEYACIHIYTIDNEKTLKLTNPYSAKNGILEKSSENKSSEKEKCTLLIKLLHTGEHYDLLIEKSQVDNLDETYLFIHKIPKKFYLKFKIKGNGDCLYTAIAAYLIYISGLTKEQAIKLALYGRNEDEVPTPESTSGKPTPAPVSKLPLQLSSDMSKKLKKMLNIPDQYLEEKKYEEISATDIDNNELNKLCTYDLIKKLLFDNYVPSV